jgi:hypothetical protein
MGVYFGRALTDVFGGKENLLGELEVLTHELQ